jgi:hypothetical protein
MKRALLNTFGVREQYSEGAGTAVKETRDETGKTLLG